MAANANKHPMQVITIAINTENRKRTTKNTAAKEKQTKQKNTSAPSFKIHNVQYIYIILYSHARTCVKNKKTLQTKMPRFGHHNNVPVSHSHSGRSAENVTAQVVRIGRCLKLQPLIRVIFNEALITLVFQITPEVFDRYVFGVQIAPHQVFGSLG